MMDVIVILQKMFTKKLVESGYILRNRTHVINFDTIATIGAFSVSEDKKTITFMNY